MPVYPEDAGLCHLVAIMQIVQHPFDHLGTDTCTDMCIDMRVDTCVEHPNVKHRAVLKCSNRNYRTTADWVERQQRTVAGMNSHGRRLPAVPSGPHRGQVRTLAAYLQSPL